MCVNASVVRAGATLFKGKGRQRFFPAATEESRPAHCISFPVLSQETRLTYNNIGIAGEVGGLVGVEGEQHLYI